MPFGFEAIVRFVPTIASGDDGKFSYFGWDVRYSIDQWIQACPVNIAAHFMTQKLNFKSKADEDIFTGYDASTGRSITIPGFDVNRTNKFRFTVGARLLLLFTNVHAEYSIAKKSGHSIYRHLANIPQLREYRLQTFANFFEIIIAYQSF